MKISIFYENFNCWWKFQLLMKISIFDEKFYFLWKFQLLMKISIFDDNFNFDQTFHFWPKFKSVTNHSVFDKGTWTHFIASFLVWLLIGIVSRSYGVMAITQDFESCNPSSNLGRTLLFFYFTFCIINIL